MSEDKDYACTLDAASLKKAKEELNEIPEDRLAAVQALRTWIQDQPHISWPALDTKTLLVYLRGAKFSQVRARDMIEGHLRMRNEAPYWFKNVDPMEPRLHKVLNEGFFFPLPKKDKEGRQIILQRMGASGKLKVGTHMANGAIDPYYKRGYDQIDQMKMAMVFGIHLQMSEITQVNGSIFIMDLSGMTAKHVTNAMANTDMQKWHKKWQKNNPGRFKKFIMYNGGTLFETLFTFMKTFIAKKYQERMVVCETAEKLYKEVAMELLPIEYLPDDYNGPNAGSVKEIAENFKNEVTKPEVRNRIVFRTGDKFSIDESKRPSESKAPTEHFRKLNVD